MASTEHGLVAPTKVVWYRSTYYNALVLGFANFFAPGLWGAMNSLGYVQRVYAHSQTI